MGCTAIFSGFVGKQHHSFDVAIINFKRNAAVRTGYQRE